MLTREDIRQIESRGSQVSTIETQIENFKKGFPFLKIEDAATINNGIIQLTNDEIARFRLIFEKKQAEGIHLLKFVPASGAASRMFKSLFSALEKCRQNATDEEIRKDKEVAAFFDRLADFAFYDDLMKAARKSPDEISGRQVLDLVLLEAGLNYGNLPKGLLKFHRYEDGSRTPLEEHCVEGALYAKDSSGKVCIHFTVSPEHQDAFSKHVQEVVPLFEELFDATYDISFSQQKASTDTIAVTPDNEPFRNADGSLLFRPAGHGALLENLNDLDADVVFIKNIDNVVPDYRKEPTIIWKKVLAGLLLDYQEKIFYYQHMLNEHHYYGLDSAFYSEAASFLENILCTKPAQNLYYTEKEELHQYLKAKFNRPIRVCGMVKNEGEPGGGPFWAKNSDGSVSLQIAESSQIDFNDPIQAAIAQNATHFNPVDLVCGLKNYKGEKYDLTLFSDPQTGFISTKSKDGKELKAQELPGLWNGAMSDWNTLFVEVPVETFNPVKTVTDLLRKEHQPE